MNSLFLILTIVFIVVAAAMVLIVLVQRPQGGGLAGAFGGAGGGGTDTVFGGRVGDALTWATVIAFTIYIGLAISLNKVNVESAAATPAATGTISAVDDPAAAQPGEAGGSDADGVIFQPVTDPAAQNALDQTLPPTAGGATDTTGGATGATGGETAEDTGDGDSEQCMLRSMTGFGSASADVDGAHYMVEIRSVNNKFFKAMVRAPEELQGIEPEIETALARRLNRGSVVITIRFADNSEHAAAQINARAIQYYLDQLKSVPQLRHEGTSIDLGALLTLPGVVMNDTGEERLARARSVLLDLIGKACTKVESMRVREGELVHGDLQRHCRVIGEHLEVIIERVPGVVEQYQQRLRQRMTSLLEDRAPVREEDLIREVAVYAERTDVAEEVARLQGHLEQFAEIIDGAGDEPVGRTLDFLSQEMLREANTIASKCLDVEISRRIVETKGAIDRIKEQAQNVE